MNWPSYLIQVNIYLVLFYAFYVCVLQNETFFKWNRIFLVSSGVLSFLVPVMQSEWVKSMFVTEEIEQVTQVIAINPAISLNEVQITPTVVDESLSLTQWILLIYIAGVVLYALRFIWQLLRVSKSFNESSQAQSFFRKIKVSEDIPARDTIVKHEEIHALQLHSADVIFFELIGILNWFNPVVYAYKKSVRYIHEFIADESASSYTGKSEYALLLVSNVFGIQKEQLANNFFNQSLLKKRIVMLHKAKSRKTALLKYGLSAPLFAAMIIFSSATISRDDIETLKEVKLPISSKIAEVVSDRSSAILKAVTKSVISDSAKTKTINSAGSTIIQEVKKALNSEIIIDPPTDQTGSQQKAMTITIRAASDTSGVFDIKSLDTQPEYPGGMKEFYSWIAKNYKLTDAAIKAGVSGRIIIAFVVEKNGTLSDLKTLKDVGYGTGEAAHKILATSKSWKPGVKNGVPVRVAYVLPIAVSTSNDKRPSDTSKISSVVVIKISGNRSILEVGKKPIIIIDGRRARSPIPETFNFNTADENSFSELLNIKPDDIKSITVLKDKASIEKYGNEGRNGVLLIATKAVDERREKELQKLKERLEEIKKTRAEINKASTITIKETEKSPEKATIKER
ncbi:MAG: energy transducer TonB [Pyrinomonadaceae bacterium]|nr:energy transducer TonB [Sphingobacteriaceae bacterium]